MTSKKARICEWYEAGYAKQEESIGSLGADYPFICNMSSCEYNNLDETTKICRTKGKITRKNIEDLAKQKSTSL